MSALLFLIVPLALLWLAQRVPLLDRIGVVPLMFLAGFAVAILADPGAIWAEGLQQTVIEVSVALALPLVIFAANIRRALRDAGGALRAMGAALVSVVVASLAGALLFRGQIDGLPQVAALSVGAYTGSNVNMGAINTALNGDAAIFGRMITYDIVFSVVYMLAILLVGSRLAGLILPPHAGGAEGDATDMEHLTDDSAASYRRLLAPGSWPGTALVLGAAAVVVGASVGIAALFPDDLSSLVTILAITTLGIAGSLIPALHRVRTSFHLGMVLILIFGFATGTTLDTSVFTDMDGALAGYFLTVIFGSMILQALICRVIGVDRDTYLIASGAAVMSVPFIPVIAGAIHNRALLVPGIAIAIIGYAVGTYLGLAVAAGVSALG